MAKTRVPRTRAGGTWTEARYWTFIRSNLRKMWIKWPVRYKVLEKARRPKPKNKKGRHKWEYKCVVCKKWFLNPDVEVDHITECGKLTSFEDLPQFVSTLLCEEDNLQVICKQCHRKKTNNG